MSLLSVRTKKKAFDVCLAAVICSVTLFAQLTILNYISLQGVTASLPLVVTITWGLVFGSPLAPMTWLQLRKASAGDVFARQIASGSISGGLVGLYFGCLYAAQVPAFPAALPVVGWIAGYFCLRSLSRANLLCIPMVLLLTVLAEGLTAWELSLLGRPGALEHFASIILPEALLNSVIAPFVYFPLRRWYDMAEGQRALAAE